MVVTAMQGKDQVEILELNDLDLVQLDEAGVDPQEILLILNKRMSKIEVCEAIKEVEFSKYKYFDYGLCKYIILEKYRNNSIDMESRLTSDFNRYFENSAWYRHVFEESYIVDLIERHSGEKSDFDNWKYNYKYLQQYYDELYEFDKMSDYGETQNLEDYGRVKKWYVDRYIKAYYYIDQEGSD